MTNLMVKKGNDDNWNMSLKYSEFNWETNSQTQILKMFFLANIHVYDYDNEVSVPPVFQTLFDFNKQDVLDLNYFTTRMYYIC